MKRPFLFIAVAFAAGIACGYGIPLPIAVSLAAGLVCALLAPAMGRHRALSRAALILALFFCGMAAYRHAVTLPPGHIAYLAGDKPEKVTLRGIVVDDPVVDASFYGKEKKSFTLDLSGYKRSQGAWTACRGLVRVDQYFKQPRELSYGDEVTAEGFLYRPAGLKNPGLFDYARYLALRDVYAICKIRENYVMAVTGRYRGNPLVAFAYKARGAIRAAIDRYLEYPYNGFIKAIMIGDRSALPDRVTDDFVRTGTVHILAISGLNLGIIAAIILAVFGVLRVPRRVNLALTLAAVGVYTVTAGSSPPVIRAAVIFAVYVVGALIRRDADMLNSLGIAAFGILLWNPRELFDPSFQLSFMSVAAIIVLTPAIESACGFSRIRGHAVPAKIAHYLTKGIAVSMAAWLGTWPVVALYFNIVSPVSLLANLVIVPALTALTVVSTVFLAFALIPSAGMAAAAGTAAAAVTALAQATFAVNHLFAIVPSAFSRVGAPAPCVLILYYALLGALLLPSQIRARAFVVRRTVIVAALLALLNIVVWQGVLSIGKGPYTVTFLDVGQGDAAVIRTPSGGTVLVDGGTGGDEEKFDAGEHVIAPYLWNRGVRRIDAIVVTHFHDDHLGGIIYLLDAFDVGAVIDSGAQAFGSRLRDVYLDALHEKGLRHLTVREGDLLQFDGASLYLLNPPKGDEIADSNDDSLVGKFVSNDLGVLLCGDVQEEGLARLEGYGPFLRSDVVKIPHHGSSLGADSAIENFLSAVSPKVAVISVARVNRYNAPSKNVLAALAALNIRTYATKDSGAVIITKSDMSAGAVTTAGK